MYSFEEVSGGSDDWACFLYFVMIYFPLETCSGDVTYNTRRNILGALSVTDKISYHLFNVEYSQKEKSSYNVRVLKKAKWHPQQATETHKLRN